MKTKEINVKTLDTHWDCECNEQYIHSKADRMTCPVCGTDEANSPDSRINEMTECNIFKTNNRKQDMKEAIKKKIVNKLGISKEWAKDHLIVM